MVSTVPALQRRGAAMPSDKGSHSSSSTASEQGALCWGQESGREQVCPLLGTPRATWSSVPQAGIMTLAGLHHLGRVL